MFIFGSDSRNQDEFTVSFFSRQKLFKFGTYANSLDHLDCSHGVLAVFIIKFLFQEANFSPHQPMQLLELSLVLFPLTIWISDCLCLAHIATRNQDVSFIRDGSSSSYFSRKLFEFGAYANSLDHLDCSHNVLAVFYNQILFQEEYFYPHQSMQLELALVLLPLTIWISDCLC